MLTTCVWIMLMARNANSPLLEVKGAGLLRRLAAMAYDALLLAGVLFCVTLALILARLCWHDRLSGTRVVYLNESAPVPRR